MGSVDDLDMVSMDKSSDDTRCLLWPSFMAAPLLNIGNRNEELRFSGNDCITNNSDGLGCIIDAYVHHSIVDSNGEFLIADVQGVLSASTGALTLFDPQAHTSESLTENQLAYWPLGWRAREDENLLEIPCL